MQATSLCSVKPDTLVTCLVTLARALRPGWVWGSPGIGKSDIVRQVAAQLNAFIIDIRASQWDAVDTRGVPYVLEGITRWAIPSVFPTKEEAAKHPLVVIFLDELNSARPAVQAALYQLILDRRLGEYVLPDNVVIFAAGNLETDRAVTHRMSTALANRFSHLELLVDVKAWERWAIDADIHMAVIAFMRFRPGLLHQWDARSDSKAQATPRTWEYASDLLKQIEADGINGAVEAALMTGTLGEAVGTEFVGFLKIYRTLPDPDAIIMNPDTAPLLDDPAANFAICGALAERASQGNVDRILKYSERLSDHAPAGPEFMTLLVTLASKRHPEIHQTKGFVKWALDHQEVLVGQEEQR